MGTAIKHPVADRVKPAFEIFDIRVIWASECPDVKSYEWRLNPVWHRMLYSCTHMATVGIKGLVKVWTHIVYTRNSHVLFLASKLVTTVRFQKRKTTAVFFASVTLDCISLAVDSEHVSSGRECGDNKDMNTLSPSDKHTYTPPRLSSDSVNYDAMSWIQTTRLANSDLILPTHTQSGGDQEHCSLHRDTAERAASPSKSQCNCTSAI